HGYPDAIAWRVPRAIYIGLAYRKENDRAADLARLQPTHRAGGSKLERAMDGELLLLGLAAIVAFFLGPIGFFLTLGARGRLTRVETLQARVALLEREIAALKSGPSGEPPADRPAQPAPTTAPLDEDTLPTPLAAAASETVAPPLDAA